MNKLRWFVLCALFACSDRIEWTAPTQITARIESSATSFEQLSVAVFTEKDKEWRQVSATKIARADVQWPFDVTIIPEKGSPRGHLFELVVQLEGAGSTILAKQRKLTSFIAHEQHVLDIDLWVGPCNGTSPVCEASEECHGDACLTCVSGSCVPPPIVRDLPYLDASPGPDGSSDATLPPDADAGDAAAGDADAGDAEALDADAGDADAGDADASNTDGSADAAPDVIDVPLPNCLTPDSGIKCDDGVYCNGAEVCDPTRSRDASGCAPGESVSCTEGTTCDEVMHACVACGGSPTDADRDGHVAKSCGGDDCRDDDARTHPGAAELCDGIDNDCDGMSDGPLAAAMCPALAGGHATCESSTCGALCDNPDWAPLNGACAPKGGWCSGVTSCGTGTCVADATTYHCGCGAGFAPSTDLKSCIDILECATANGGCAQTCINEVGSYHCACTTGVLDPNGKACNQATKGGNNCQGVTACGTGTCESWLFADKPYLCTCPSGYSGTNTQACADIDECTTGSAGCGATCVNEGGSYHCTCTGNDTLAEDGKACRTQTWSTVQTLSAAPGHDISVAMIPAGTAFAVWTEDLSTFSAPPYAIRGSLCSSFSWAPAGTVRPSESGNGGSAFAFLDSSGWPSAAGVSTGQGGSIVWGARYPAYEMRTLGQGGFGSGSVRFSGNRTNPYVAISNVGLNILAGQSDGSWTASPVLSDGSASSFTVSTSGTVLVLSTVYVSPDSRSYWLSRLSGNAWSTPVQLGTGTSEAPTAAVLDGSGVSHLFWVDTAILRHTRVSEGGTILGTDDLPLASSVPPKGDTLLARAGTSNVAVSWVVPGSPDTIFVSTWSARRGWQTTDFSHAATGTPLGKLKIAMSQNDQTLLAVWRTQAGGAATAQLFSSQSNDLGATWSTAAPINSAGSSSYTDYDLAGSGRGAAALVWSEPAGTTTTAAVRARLFR